MDQLEAAALGAAIATVIGAVVAGIVVLLRGKTERETTLSDHKLKRRKEEEEIEQDAESYQIKKLKEIIRDQDVRHKEENRNCDDRIKSLHQEIQQLRELERKSYSESIRQAEIIKVLERQVRELTRGLNKHGIDVETEENTGEVDLGGTS